MHIWGSEPRGGTRVSRNARGEHGPLPTSTDTTVKKETCETNTKETWPGGKKTFIIFPFYELE